MTTPHILIVEDEPDLAKLLEEYLIANAFTCQILNRGDLVATYLAENHADLILLDIQLPGKDGLSVCRDIRKTSDTPIIFITAKVEEVDRLVGLELGADDYICKPFSPREVVARVKTILRRLSPSKPTREPVVLNMDTLQMHIFDQHLELTKIEANLLKLLMSNPGKIFSRDDILKNIYSDYRIVSQRTVDTHVKKLRKKISDIYDKSEFIISIYGAGYKYEPLPTEAAL